MSDGNKYYLDKREAEQEEYDFKDEYEEIAADNVRLEARVEELEAKLAKSMMADDTLPAIVVEAREEHEDGSATYTFQIEDRTRELLVQEGLRFVLTCAAANLDTAYALEILMSYKDDPDVE